MLQSVTLICVARRKRASMLRIATDMIMLAWVDSYDIAVLVSSDLYFVPVAEFLQTKGKKVIHGQLPPRGALLSLKRCWGSIDVIKLREKFRLVFSGKKGCRSSSQMLVSRKFWPPARPMFSSIGFNPHFGFGAVR